TPARRRSTTRTAATPAASSTTVGRRLTPTATASSTGPRSTTGTAPRRSSTGTVSSTEAPDRRSTGRSTLREDDDEEDVDGRRRRAVDDDAGARDRHWPSAHRSVGRALVQGRRRRDQSRHLPARGLDLRRQPAGRAGRLLRRWRLLHVRRRAAPPD